MYIFLIYLLEYYCLSPPVAIDHIFLYTARKATSLENCLEHFTSILFVFLYCFHIVPIKDLIWSFCFSLYYNEEADCTQDDKGNHFFRCDKPVTNSF